MAFGIPVIARVILDPKLDICMYVTDQSIFPVFFG